jgi:hypothetical protein
MTLLENYLTGIGGPSLKWIKARVYSVNPDGSVILEYLGGFIPGVGTLDHYTPVEGDVVHALSLQGQGTLVLGSSSTPLAAPAPLVPQTPIILNPLYSATYDIASQTWQPGVINQGPGLVGAWGYNAVALRTVMVEKVEIEINLLDGGPPEFINHRSASASGVLAESEFIWRVPRPAAGVLSWVSLPIGWGLDLINGTINGFGLHSSGQSGTYSGTGRVRVTPLSVTM